MDKRAAASCDQRRTAACKPMQPFYPPLRLLCVRFTTVCFLAARVWLWLGTGRRGPEERSEFVPVSRGREVEGITPGRRGPDGMAGGPPGAGAEALTLPVALIGIAVAATGRRKELAKPIAKAAVAKEQRAVAGDRVMANPETTRPLCWLLPMTERPIR
jgi:hypothetical protein